MSGLRCAVCGEKHDGPPFAYGYDAPAVWSAEIAAAPGNLLRQENCELTVDGSRHFFVRGRICVPVVAAPDPFEWGVWVSLSETNYRRTLQRWSDPKRTDEPPYFAWLSTNITLNPPTVGLKTSLHAQPAGTRPTIELEPTNHPLAVEQRSGITLSRVKEIASLMLH